MVAPHKRTRSKKKVKVRTPGGRKVTRIRAEKPKKPVSAISGKPLSGMSPGTATQMRNKSKSGKTPKRPYAGVLSSGEVDSLIRYVTRMEAKYGSEELKEWDMQRDLVLEKYLPRGWFEKVSNGEILKRSLGKNPVRKPSQEKKASKPKKKTE
jgi:large subunit ribosomal protein L34e